MTASELITWKYSIARDWQQLRNAPETLRGNPALVLSALQGSWKAIKYATAVLRNDPIFMSEAVRICGHALQFGELEIRSNRALVLEAVGVTGMALQHAYLAAHRDDREVVLTAVRQDWQAFTLASTRVQRDWELCEIAVKGNWRALEFVPEECLDVRELMLDAVRQSPEALRYASDRLRGDPELQAEAAKNGVYVTAQGDAMPMPCHDLWVTAGGDPNGPGKEQKARNKSPGRRTTVAKPTWSKTKVDRQTKEAIDEHEHVTGSKERANSKVSAENSYQVSANLSSEEIQKLDAQAIEYMSKRGLQTQF